MLFLNRSRKRSAAVHRRFVSSRRLAFESLEGRRLLSTVSLTPAWFAQQGAGPYQLSSANTTYVLQTNVSTPGGAFVIAANGITLNLNGYTVTYNTAAGDNVKGIDSGWNVANVRITDGNLTQGAGSGYNSSAVYSRQGNGWEVDHLTITYQGDNNTAINQAGSGTNTASFTALDNVIHANGSKAGLWVNSATVANGGSGYAVGDTITLGGNGTFTRPTVLQVASLVSGTSQIASVTVLAQGSYTVESTGAVGQTASSGHGSGASFNLSWGAGVFDAAAASVASGGSGYKVGNVLTLSGGSIDNGAAQLQVTSVNSSGAVTGVTLSSIGSYSTPPANAVAVTGGNGSGASFNIVWGGMPIHYGNFYAINVCGTGGAIAIENNDIVGTGYQGIGFDYSVPLTSTLEITGNTIEMAASVGDGYAIDITSSTNAAVGFEIAHNTIVQSSGRGIIVEGDVNSNSPGPGNGTIHDNTITVREAPSADNPSYGDAIGICLRFGAHNVQVYNNTVTAYAGANAAPGRYASVLGSADIANGIKINAGTYGVDNQVYNNTVNVSTTDAGYTAVGLYASGSSDGSNVFSGNTVTSNSVLISTNSTDGGGSNFKFICNKLIEGSNPLGFESIQAGYWTQASTGNVYLANSWQGGASGSNVALSTCGGAAYSLTTQWYANLTVTTSGGAAISGATVTAVATGGGTDTETATTNSSGAAQLTLTQYQRSGTTYPATSNYTYFTPYTVTVTAPGYQTWTQNVTANQSLSLPVQLTSLSGTSTQVGVQLESSVSASTAAVTPAAATSSAAVDTVLAQGAALVSPASPSQAVSTVAAAGRGHGRVGSLFSGSRRCRVAGGRGTGFLEAHGFRKPQHHRSSVLEGQNG